MRRGCAAGGGRCVGGFVGGNGERTRGVGGFIFGIERAWRTARAFSAVWCG